MAGIRYEPIKEILVHDLSKMSAKELVIAKTGPNSPPRLFWCDGILFFINYCADSKYHDDMMEKGVLVCHRLFYAEKQDYEPIMSIDTEEFGGIKANVDDVSWSCIYKDIVAWIKSRKGK